MDEGEINKNTIPIFYHSRDITCNRPTKYVDQSEIIEIKKMFSCKQIVNYDNHIFQDTEPEDPSNPY